MYSCIMEYNYLHFTTWLSSGTLLRLTGKNAIPQKRYSVIIALEHRGVMGGQALSPSSSYRCLLFHLLIKGITMKVLLFRYHAEIVTTLSIRYYEYRCPRTGLLCAADR